MEVYSKQGTKQTPQINFDLKSGILTIRGRSVLKNTGEFYQELLAVLDEYTKQPSELTTLNIELEYFNTPSSSFILSVLRKMENIQNNGHKIQVNWNYVDEDMLDTGVDYQRVTNIPIKMVKVIE